MMDERIMIFIDGSNFYHGIKELAKQQTPMSSVPLDFYKLSHVLARKRKLIRTYYYTALHSERDSPLQWQKQQRYLEHLKATSYLALRSKPLVKRAEVFMEKGIDMLLAMDMTRLARLNSYDTAILVSGDADFVDIVRDVQDMGKQVELASVQRGLASSLKTICDRFTEITPVLINLCSASAKTMPEMMTVGK